MVYSFICALLTITQDIVEYSLVKQSKANIILLSIHLMINYCDSIGRFWYISSFASPFFFIPIRKAHKPQKTSYEVRLKLTSS